MTKIYITYTRFYVNIGIKADPLGYMGEPVGDSRILATIEYNEEEVQEKVFNRMIDNFSYHSFVEITPEYAIQLCNEWYGEGTFELDVDGFTLNDLRVQGE